MEAALTKVSLTPPVKAKLTPSLTRISPKNCSCLVMMSTSPGVRREFASIWEPLPLLIIAEATSFKVVPVPPKIRACSEAASFCKIAKVAPLATIMSPCPKPWTLAINVPSRTSVDS